MKKIILVLATIIAINPSFADLKFAKGPTKRSAPAAQAPQADSSDPEAPRSSSRSSGGSSTNILLGGSIVLAGTGAFGFGGNIDIGFKVLKDADWYLPISA
ncbi:MAG: hypothetical protein KA715_09030 [Xanthomonadaceae bacterium]|nr:hypothetical protein [Xanthomonadaceae bacterium]